MITPSLLKTFEMVKKWEKRPFDERIALQTANHIEKFVPLAGKDDIVELEAFTDKIVKDQKFGNRDIVKKGIERLIQDNRVLATTGRNGKVYMARYK